ncbi:MAG: transketolase [Marinilabiliales bacterium]|nr:MAG: transketolase [Marinilabiliales bacterium]
MDKKLTDKASDNIRILSAAMVEKAKSGHPGGAMGGADFINILYSEFLRFDPGDMEWFLRDRFFLDPGHMSPMLYSALCLTGHFSTDDLKNFRQWGSPTPGHPEKDPARGIENTSGPLGQGHTMAVGAAIAERFMAARFGEWMSHKIYTFISDGGVQEEISQGAGRIAGYLGLSNLIMFYDANDIQLSTTTSAVTSEDTGKKYEAWGWRVITIDGNSQDEIRNALKAANQESDKPVLIIGKTVMGKGSVTSDGSSFEGKPSTHGQPLSAAGADFERTVKNLGGDPSDPVAVFDDVKEYYARMMDKKRAEAAGRKEEQAKWEKDNPELAKKLEQFLSGVIPPIDYAGISQKADISTRAASGVVLGHFAEKIENLIVASADLANSDKTDGFLKASKPFTRGDFTGAFLHAGVSELTLAALANGMALHGGVVPAIGTFFVFSDYMKPAVRLAALMELPVKYIWTHDAFRVGEDGPTHQPVEHEAQIRLMEELRNHSGKPSMLVLRPADAAETTVAWKMAMENTDTPTALILSRQNIKDIPAAGDKKRYEEALAASKGAYIVTDDGGTPDLILVGSGSEVSTLVGGAGLLRDRKSLTVRVVSLISETLFMQQDTEYRKRLMPAGLPVFGLTAGLPSVLRNIAGPRGKVYGLDHFGYSAPAGVLDEKFGFTPENVYSEAVGYLEEYKISSGAGL